MSGCVHAFVSNGYIHSKGDGIPFPFPPSGTCNLDEMSGIEQGR